LRARAASAKLRAMSFSSTFIPIDRARPASRFEPTTRLEASANSAPAAPPEMSSVRQLAWVFAFWTLIAVAGALSEAVYQHAVGREIDWIRVFRRPLTEQWIWAALTPIVFWLARRVPLERGRLASGLALHALFFLALCLVHCGLAAAVGGPMFVPSTWHGSLFLLRFLQEFYSDIWMYWPLVCIRALLDAQRRERERALQASRLQELMAGLQLSLLRAQIQPHFLFNTMHAISALLRVDPRAAEDMLADLAEILRASFNDPTSQETSLRRELDLVGCYLRIQQRRLGDRLTVSTNVSLEALDAAVPALVLQSLVENAVVHGIAPTNRPGNLWISARRDGEELELDVRDDGAGAGESASLGRSGAGIGLANARERLLHLYGDAQRFAFESTPDRGTRVTLRLPWRLAQGIEAASGVA
jgi:two-component sensor histidine kinase